MMKEKSTRGKETSASSSEEDAIENFERRLAHLGTRTSSRTSIPTQELIPLTNHASPLIEMAAPRDYSELEGTLLPSETIPIATLWTESAANGQEQQELLASATAIPIAYTPNDTLPTADVKAAAAAAAATDNDLPTAPSLPIYQSNEDRERKEQLDLVTARQKGTIAAEAENEGIRRENQGNFSKQYYETALHEAAKKAAQQRNREGLQIKKDTWFGHAEKEVSKPDPDQTSYSKVKGDGYRVHDYDTKDYDGLSSNDYTPHEYKSVYDD